MEVVAFGLSYLFLDNNTNLTGGMRRRHRRIMRQARQLREDIAAEPNPFPPVTFPQIIQELQDMQRVPNPFPVPPPEEAPPTISAEMYADLLPATNTTAAVATPPTSRVAPSAQERRELTTMSRTPVMRRQQSDEFARRLMNSTASANNLERWVLDQENLESATGYNTTLAQARRRVAAAGAMPAGLTQRIAARLDADTD